MMTNVIGMPTLVSMMKATRYHEHSSSFDPVFDKPAPISKFKICIIAAALACLLASIHHTLSSLLVQADTDSTDSGELPYTKNPDTKQQHRRNQERKRDERSNVLPLGFFEKLSLHKKCRDGKYTEDACVDGTMACAHIETVNQLSGKREGKDNGQSGFYDKRNNTLNHAGEPPSKQVALSIILQQVPHL